MATWTMRRSIVTLAGATLALLAIAGVASAASVRDFGAVGDGVADDTAAFRAAWAADPALRVPAGVYRLTGWVSAPSTGASILGDGPGVSILRWTARGGLAFRGDQPWTTFTVRDLTLETAVDGGGTAIDARWPTPRAGRLGSGLRASDIEIRPSPSAPTAWWSAGIYLWQASGSVIERFTILGHATNPFLCDPGIRADGDTTPLTIAHGTIQSCVAGIVQTESEGLYVTQVEVVGGRWGIMRFGSAGGGTAIIGCHTNTTRAGIFIGWPHHQTQIIGNLIYRWGREDGWAGIYIDNGADGAVVQGNWIAPIDWVGTRYGIVLNAGNVLVAHNIMHGMTTGVWVKPGWQGNAIIQNQFLSPAGPPIRDESGSKIIW